MANRKMRINYSEMGARIRVARKSRKLTQENVAEAVGISTGLIGHIERGLKKPSLETLAGICMTLNIDMHYIAFGVDYFDEEMPGGIVERVEDLIKELNTLIGK